MYEKNLLKGKVAIVTGGGTGIGKDIVIKLASLGSKIVIAGRREEKLNMSRSQANVTPRVGLSQLPPAGQRC